MKRLIIGVLMSLAFLNGIRIVMAQDATIADYEGLVGQAAAEMIQFRETWGDDDFIAISRTGDAYTLQRINGQDAIIMGPIVRPKQPVELRRKPISRSGAYPVLGIVLYPKVARPIPIRGHTYHLTAVPDQAVAGFYMDKDDDLISSLTEETEEIHFRLEAVGQYDEHGNTSRLTETYEQAADNILFAEELSYRTLWDAFGNRYENVDPVFFTCGGYVPITGTTIEFYVEKDRAVDWWRQYDYVLYVGGDKIIKTGTTLLRLSWPEMEFIENYTIPDSLVADSWPAEYIARRCLPDGEYELWQKNGVRSQGQTGHSYHWLHGASTQGIGHYERNEHNACLYAHYIYDGSTGGQRYFFEMVLYVDGGEEGTVEIVVSSGTRTPTSDMPDDIYVHSFEAYDFYGTPVYVFGYVKYAWSRSNYIKYGMYYNGTLTLTDEYIIDADGHHEVLLPEGAADGETLYGWGDAVAFGIEEDDTTINLEEITEQQE